jgi:glutamate carboxypeptidase
MSLTDHERKLAAAIERKRSALLEDLKLHVALPTGLNNAPALDETRDRFATRLAALGALREDYPGDPRPDWLFDGRASLSRAKADPGATPPTAVCRRVRGGGPKVLIAGHLDTVHDPAGSFRELSIAPDGRTAVGPGCVDMKGGLVIAVAALEALEECGIAASWSFLMNSDEETGSYHSDRVLAAEARVHDFGLALEPAMSKGELAVERGGSGQFMIETFGKAAHVGRDFASGISAVDAMARAVVASHEFSDAASGVCVNIGPLLGGVATNVVPDHARAWGNVRFPDPARGSSLEANLAGLATPRTRLGESGTLSASQLLPRVEVYTSFNRPAKPLTPATERLALAARAVAEELGQKLPFGKTAGVCDGNQLQAVGLPTIDTLGVRGGGLHTPVEWIELPSLVERCQLLAILIARLSSGAVAGR